MRIAEMKQMLGEIRDCFTAIEGDYTNPIGDCREGKDKIDALMELLSKERMIILEFEPDDLKRIIEELEPSVQAENDSSEQSYWKGIVDYLRENMMKE